MKWKGRLFTVVRNLCTLCYFKLTHKLDLLISCMNAWKVTAFYHFMRIFNKLAEWKVLLCHAYLTSFSCSLQFFEVESCEPSCDFPTSNFRGFRATFSSVVRFLCGRIGAENVRIGFELISTDLPFEWWLEAEGCLAWRLPSAVLSLRPSQAPWKQSWLERRRTWPFISGQGMTLCHVMRGKCFPRDASCGVFIMAHRLKVAGSSLGAAFAISWFDNYSDVGEKKGRQR